MTGNTAAQYLFLTIFFGALLAGAALLLFHRSLIYRFDQAPSSAADAGIAGLEIKTFLSEDGHATGVWIKAPVGDAPVILYFTGNFSSTARSAKRLIPLAKLGYGLAVLEYRGSGGAGGRPSEAAFQYDARAMYDRLDALLGRKIPTERRILHGFSLGTGIAVPLALERGVAAVVLESPFATLADYFTRKYRGLPMRRLMWSDRYDIARQIGGISAPVLMLRGESDRAIPQYSFAELARKAPASTEIRTYPQGGHSDLASFGSTADILAFYRLHINGAP